jgi:hypothetical protein
MKYLEKQPEPIRTAATRMHIDGAWSAAAVGTSVLADQGSRPKAASKPFRAAEQHLMKVLCAADFLLEVHFVDDVLQDVPIPMFPEPCPAGAFLCIPVFAPCTQTHAQQASQTSMRPRPPHVTP